MLLTTLVVGETAPSTTLGTMIVVSGAFLILMLLLKKYAWGAIVDILTQREEKIANDLDSAEQSLPLLLKKTIGIVKTSKTLLLKKAKRILQVLII